MLVITSMDHLAYYVSNLAGVLLNGFPAHDDQPPPRVGDLAILEVVTIPLLSILLAQQLRRHGLIIILAASSSKKAHFPIEFMMNECQTKIGPRSSIR